MASENEQDSCETCADIADMIRRAVESMGDEMPYTTSAGTMRRVADRLEAALKRERAEARVFWTKKCRETITEHDRYCSPVGNAAAMREALARIVEIAKAWADPGADAAVTLGLIIDKAESALSAPARNCDKYATADEALKAQQAAFDESNFENGECKLGCPGCDDFPTKCEVRWLFAPAEKGGAE